VNEFEIYEQAVKHYGKLNQLIKAMEECGELVHALARWTTGLPDFVNVCEEIADVEIMLEQVKIILGDRYEELLTLKKAEKLGKLAERLGMEKYAEEEKT